MFISICNGKCVTKTNRHHSKQLSPDEIKKQMIPLPEDLAEGYILGVFDYKLDMSWTCHVAVVKLPNGKWAAYTPENGNWRFGYPVDICDDEFVEIHYIFSTLDDAIEILALFCTFMDWHEAIEIATRCNAIDMIRPTYQPKA